MLIEVIGAGKPGDLAKVIDGPGRTVNGVAGVIEDVDGGRGRPTGQCWRLHQQSGGEHQQPGG